MSNENTSLVVLGTGIKFISHLTVEAKTYLTQSQKVLYLLNEPAMAQWIEENAQQAESMEFLYRKYPLRRDCYQAITDYILETLRQNIHLCVALYGHPSVFAQPGLDAVIQARQEGFDARVLPGISAEDCLFADLCFDPGSVGCQSFEATDFLIHQRRFDPNAHLVLWQIGFIGNLSHQREGEAEKGIIILTEALQEIYPDTHEVTIYESALYPHKPPHLKKVPLSALPQQTFSRLSTLYVPPKSTTKPDENMLEKLGVKTR